MARVGFGFGRTEIHEGLRLQFEGFVLVLFGFPLALGLLPIQTLLIDGDACGGVALAIFRSGCGLLGVVPRLRGFVESLFIETRFGEFLPAGGFTWGELRCLFEILNSLDAFGLPPADERIPFR